jgi:hypothetical protein
MRATIRDDLLPYDVRARGVLVERVSLEDNKRKGEDPVIRLVILPIRESATSKI